MPNSSPKWTKSLPVFRPKRHKKATLWGGTYPYGLHKKYPPGLRLKRLYYIYSEIICHIFSVGEDEDPLYEYYLILRNFHKEI